VDAFPDIKLINIISLCIDITRYHNRHGIIDIGNNLGLIAAAINRYKAIYNFPVVDRFVPAGRSNTIEMNTGNILIVFGFLIRALI
jgi:hypothetical protein